MSAAQRKTTQQKTAKEADNRTRARRASRSQPAVLVASPSMGATGLSGAAAPKSIGQVRQILTDAFEGIGGQRGFERWAKKNPAKFYEMWSRMLPRQSNVDVTVTSLEELLAKVAAQEGEREVIDGGQLCIDHVDTVTDHDDAMSVPVSDGTRQDEAETRRTEDDEPGGRGVPPSKRRRRL